MARLLAAAVALAFALTSLNLPASAADEASDVTIDVVDAATGAPIALARVLLQGERGTIGYTDAQGHARFESVATGTYRARVTKRGYVSASSRLLEVVTHLTTSIRVALSKPGSALKTIGTVTVSSSPARASREVGQDDALRHLDGSLRDALGDLPGLTSSGDGISIDGMDASQTGTSLDGVPVPGAGGSFGARGLNSDLFAGASASSGASNGGLGGNVGFRTLQPTRFPQALATLQYGSQNDSAALLVGRGSLHNLGYVVEHAVRGTNDPLTGATFTDESGLTYSHDGNNTLSGNLAKFRWSPALSQTLTLTAASTDTQNALACHQFTARFPCGGGPNEFVYQHGAVASLVESATIGSTTLFFAGFANQSRFDSDQGLRRFAGVPAPLSDSSRAFARGVTFSLQLPAGELHEISFAGTTYGLTFNGSTTNGFGTTSFTQASSFRSATVIDRIRPNRRLTLTARTGINGGSGNSSVLSALDVRWQPTKDVAYSLTGAAGDAGSSIVINGLALPDPRSLTFDCTDGVASGTLPATNAPAQRSSSLRASVERSGKRGRVALTAWTQHLQNAPVLAAFDGASIGLPAGYPPSVAALASSPFVCGAGAAPALAFTSFVPADQLARGVTIAGTLNIGTGLLAGYATVQSRFVTGATPATSGLTPAGMQVPDAPLHRAGLVASVKLGRAVDALANVSYTSANNPSRLPAYTLFNAGFATPLKYGTLAVVGTNLTNQLAGAYAHGPPLSFTGHAPLALAATPLRGRGIQATYTVRAGRLGTTGSGAGTTEPTADDQEGSVRITIRATDLPDAPQPDALTIDPDNESCTPIAAKAAQSVLDAIGTIRSAAERAKRDGRYPETLSGIPGTVSGIPLRYQAYDDGARYVVIATGVIPAGAAMLNCARLHGGPPEEMTQRHLYQPTGARNAFLIIYAPSVGLYLMPPTQAPRGGVLMRAEIDPIPEAAPADPYALKTSCPASSKPVVDALVIAMKAAHAASPGTPPATSDVAVITSHDGTPRWFEIVPRDQLANGIILNCLHVAGVPPDRLKAAGIDDARRQGLGFSDRFGFYVVGGLQQRPPGPSTPAASPAPAR
jgi:hypothetical protein